MSRLILLLSLAIALPCAVAASSPAGGPLSRKELTALVKTAHTSEQYDRLSRYFHHEADRLEHLAKASNDELNHELATPSYGSKYPNAADRARRWRDIYSEQAQQMRQRALSYHRKAMALETQPPLTSETR